MNKNFNSRVMKRAWTIRRLAAMQYGVKVSQISWRECLAEASAVVLALPNNKDKGMKMATPNTAAEIAEYITRITGISTLRATDDNGYKLQVVEWVLIERDEDSEDGDVYLTLLKGSESYSHYLIKVESVSTDTVKFSFPSLEEALTKIQSIVKDGIELPTSQKWVARGNTYPAREQLKAAGFRWNGSVWFYQGVDEPHFHTPPRGVSIYKI